MKALAVVACILLTLMMVAPVTRQAFAVKSSAMNVIQYRFFGSQDSLFTALQTPDSAGGIDIMDWPLTNAQYQTIMYNPSFSAAPYREAGEYELAFNSNFTNAARPTAGRAPMNYTDFRQAMACLVDKPYVIAGPMLQGFATRDDTEIPMPLMQGYVNPAVAYPFYPWEYTFGTVPTHALQILWDGGWYNQAYFDSFANLVSNYTNGGADTSGAQSLLKAGTATGVVYPTGNILQNGSMQPAGVDIFAQLYASDTYNNGALAGTAIPSLNGYYRTGDGRRDLGLDFDTMLGHMGIPDTLHPCSSLSVLRPPVMEDYIYDWCTLGYGMTSPPNWWYSAFTPAGIYFDGPNPYLVDDSNMTHWAYAALTDATQAGYMTDIMNVQEILVEEAYIVSVYTPTGYCAYKTGMLGMLAAINELGYGYGGQNQLLSWIMMNVKKSNTINYTGDPTLTPESNIIYYGEYNPPDGLNPIFSNKVFDFEVLDEVFTYPLATNPYSEGYLPWMAYDWKLETFTNPVNASLPAWSNVTYWFRNDIYWQDGAKFKVDDVVETIYLNALYADAWTHDTFMHMVNTSDNYQPYVQKWNDYCASFWVDNPSWLNLYAPNWEIVPKHIYENIVPTNITNAKLGLDTHSLHGVWPGAQALYSEFLSTPEAAQYGITYTNVSTLSLLEIDGGKYTWVGTGPFVFRAGSAGAHEQYATTVGGGVTLDANPNFWMKISATFVVCSPNPASSGSSVTCTTTVLGISPTGNVTWSTSSSTGNFSQSVCALSNGTCSTTYTDSLPGSVNIAASYSGDSGNMPSSGSTTLTVTSGGPVYYSQNYPSVQAVINAAPPNSTVVIAAGFYTECLTVNKRLTIIGERDQPGFSSGGSGIFLTLQSGASGTIVTGIEITNFDEGIVVQDASNCGIFGNTMSSITSTGIMLQGSHATGNVVCDNVFEDTSTPINLTASATGNSIYDNIISSQSTLTFNVGSNGNSIHGNIMSAAQIVVNMTNSQNNILYNNNFLAAVQITIMTGVGNTWDAGYPAGGNYWSDYKTRYPVAVEIGQSGIWNTAYVIDSNNKDNYPLMQPWNPVAGHDVAVLSVVAVKTVIGKGYSGNFTMAVANVGEYSESFSVAAYANTTVIYTPQTNSLGSANQATLAFRWDTTSLAYGNYTLSVWAWPVPSETDIANNNFTLGIIKVTIPGDINGDFAVGLSDLGKLAKAYSSHGPNYHYKGEPASQNWNPNADINNDGTVGLPDLGILAKHFNQHYP